MPFSSEALHKTIFDFYPEAIVVADTDWRITSVNSAFTELFGYDPADVVTKPVAMLHPVPADTGEADPSGKAAPPPHMGGRGPTCCRCSDGGTFLADTSARAVHDAAGEVFGHVLLYRKLSALTDSALRYQRLYHETPAMLHSIDTESRLVEVSDDWLRRMGYDDRDEVIGRKLADFLNKSSRDALDEVIPRFWLDGVIRDVQRTLIRKDGSTFDAEISAIVDPYSDEGNRRSLSVILDVSERNRALRDLQRKNAELERLNEELDTFASVASHDLQEPLRKIRRFSEILVEEAGGSLSGDAAYALEVMRRAAARMQTLITDLLAYARTANAAMEKQTVDLGQVLDRVQEDLSIQIAEAGAVLDADRLPTVQGDPVQLQLLMQNLIDNAVKYREPSRSSRIRVTTAACTMENALLVSVQDNGVGFDPRFANELFLPFRRLTASHHPAGSGLGLTICGRIVQRHGWSLRAVGRPGSGAVFTVVIPAERAGLAQY